MHRITFSERGLSGPFLCCFCGHTGKYEAEHGLLSQWRGYGAGGGVSIVLDTRKIEAKLKEEQMQFEHSVNHIGNVVYSDEADKIQAEFNDLFLAIKVYLKDYYERKHEAAESFCYPFIKAATMIKHHAFHEEREIRVVVAPISEIQGSIFHRPGLEQRKEIRYRLRCGTDIPYIALFNANKGSPLPIKRVIIGPSLAQNFNYQRVREILTGSSIDVTKSHTPFTG